MNLFSGVVTRLEGIVKNSTDTTAIDAARVLTHVVELELALRQGVRPVFWRYAMNGFLFVMALISSGLFTAIAGHHLERSFEVKTEVAEKSSVHWLKEMRLWPVTNVVVCEGALCSAWVMDVGVIPLECDDVTCTQR